jgi:hypothetical protein
LDFAEEASAGHRAVPAIVANQLDGGEFAEPAMAGEEDAAHAAAAEAFLKDVWADQ